MSPCCFLYVSSPFPFLSPKRGLMSASFICALKRVNILSGPADSHVISAGERPLWPHTWFLARSIPATGLLSVRGCRATSALRHEIFHGASRMARWHTAGAKQSRPGLSAVAELCMAESQLSCRLSRPGCAAEQAWPASSYLFKSQKQECFF